MPVLPIEISEFGGLDLVQDPQEIQHTGAIDGIDFDLIRLGRLRSRDGYASFAPALPASWDMGVAMSIYPGDGPHIASFGTNASGKVGVKMVDINGLEAHYTPVDSGAATVTAGTQGWGVELGTAGAYRWFFTTDGATPILSMTSSTAGTADAALATYGGGPLAVTPWDFRLVMAKGDRVRFSDPGAPTTVGVNNYIDLTPNDGEAIADIAVWGNQMFVFKQTKFFVFTQPSVGPTGQPIFNYRQVAAGQGVRYSQGSLATDEGVFFVNAGGLWLTQGGTPQKMSRKVDPLFNGSYGPAVSAGLYTILNSAVYRRLVTYRRKLCIYTGYGMLILDRDTGQWSASSVPVSAPAAFDPAATLRAPADTSDLFHSLRTSSTTYRTSSSYTTDAGTAITGRYRTGFITPAVFSSARTRRGYPWPGAEGVVREWLIDGQGTVLVKTAYNDYPTLGSSASVSLGIAPVTSQGRDRRAVRGRNVSVEVSGAAPWQVSRMIANVQSSRGPGNEAEA